MTNSIGQTLAKIIDKASPPGMSQVAVPEFQTAVTIVAIVAIVDLNNKMLIDLSHTVDFS
jgi:hypothetical protein